MTGAYYSDDLVTLYCGDAFDLAELWTRADVLVTDPPYGIAYESGWSEWRSIEGDDTPAARDAALQIWGDGPALVFGSWRAPRPPHTRQRLLWDKGTSPGMGDMTSPWGPADEEIYVLGSGFVGARRSNVYRQNTVPPAHRPAHPTPKPVPLMRALIDYCPPGVIADPFAGSGSTLIAARDAGRRAIGVEIDPDYCAIAAQRLGLGVTALF